MRIGRFIGRFVGSVVALGVGALVLIPAAMMIAVVAIPALIALAVGGVVGAVALLSFGVPALVALVLGAVAIAAVLALTVGLISLGVVVLKVAFFLMLISWLVRMVTRRGRRSEPMLVGMPVADVAAPLRDKYDIAAERELEEELGI